MASRVTPPATKEEGAEEDKAEEGGAAEAVGLVDSMHGRFD